MRVSLDRIKDRLRSEGIAAHVDQTGGGCATLYAGPSKKDDTTGEVHFAAAAGAGWFERNASGDIEAFAETNDLCVGPDDEEGPYVYLEPTDTEEDVFVMVGVLALNQPE